MPYPTKEQNEAAQAVAPVLISVQKYAALVGISPASARREVIAGRVPSVEFGDRRLIPADFPGRQAAEALAEWERRKAESKKLQGA